jgi:HAE1 family hydrophobic/amphiphilic exporter-1
VVDLARISLGNRVLAALLAFMVVVFGIVAGTSIRTEFFPPTATSQALITVSHPGASPEVMEQEVAVPVETAVGSLPGLDTVESTSANGFATVIATFDVDTDPEAALDEVRQAVNTVRSDLPDGSEVEVADTNDEEGVDYVLSLAAMSAEDPAELSERVAEDVLPELEGIEGVRRVDMFGQREEYVEIVPDREEMEDADLTPYDLAESLRQGGLVLPGGTMSDEERSVSVNVDGEYDSLEAIEDRYVMPAVPPEAAFLPGAEEPDPVRLGEVAEVRWAEEEPRTISRGNASETISLIVYKERDANLVEVSNAVQAELPGLADRLGEGGDVFTTIDSAPFIEESIDGLVEKGLIGLAAVVLLILLFLMSVRTTIVTALSVPLSLLITLIVLWQADYTLNMLTLAGLTVAIGRVVDDAIVVLENIKRHLSYGGDRTRAVIDGTREVSAAIVSSTLAGAAVFLPVAFLGGSVGVFFRPFAVTVAVALLASLLVALTIIPVLAYWFVRAPAVAPEDRERIMAEAQERERRGWLQRAYIPVLGAVTRRGRRGWRTGRRWAVLAAGFLVLLGTLAMSTGLRFVFMEEDGQNQLSVSQELPPGTALEATDAAAAEVEEVLSGVDGVVSFETTVGGDGFSSASNLASYWVTVDPEADVDAVRGDIQDRLDGLEDAGELRVTGLFGGTGGGDDTTASVTLLSDDTAALRDAEERVAEVMADVDGVTRTASDLTEEEPVIRITPDSEEMAERGITEEQLAAASESALGGLAVGTLLVGGAEDRVVIDTGSPPDTVGELRDHEIEGPAGSVDLGDVAEVEEVEEPTQIVRSDGERSVTVHAAVSGDADLNAVSTEVMDRVADLDLPAQVTPVLGGTAEELQEVESDMGVALLASIAISFVVMVATFRSLGQPVILMVSVPFAATGTVAALLLTDTPMSLSAMIGLLMLVGIVVTNAIVLIDLINQYRRAGMPLQEAVVEGGRQRLRPILMTALATVGALVPMAIGWGTGSMFIAQSLAIVVIGGLVSSTILSLLIIPTLYVMLEETKERAAERRRRRRERRRARAAAPAAAGASTGTDGGAPGGGDAPPGGGTPGDGDGGGRPPA